MVSILNIHVNASGQFRVLIPPGGELQDPEEARTVEVEITCGIRESIRVFAEHQFTGDIHVTGQIDKIRASVAEVMQKWANYFRECLEWNRPRFRAAQAYSTRREIRVQFRSSHASCPPKRWNNRNLPNKNRQAHFRTQINGRLALLEERLCGTGKRRELVDEIKSFYNSRLYTLLTSKGLGIEIRGTPRDILSGIVGKTTTRLLYLDAKDEEVRQNLAKLEREANCSYPSLQIDVFPLHPTPSSQQSIENRRIETPSQLAARSSGDLSSRPSPLPELPVIPSQLPPLAFIPPDAIGDLPLEGEGFLKEEAARPLHGFFA